MLQGYNMNRILQKEVQETKEGMSF